MADTEGFEEFYTATVGRLLGQLYPVTGDLHEAEELVEQGLDPLGAAAGLRPARGLGAGPADAPAAGDRAPPPGRPAPRGGGGHAGARTGTVKSWLARGRRALADRLGEPEEVLS